MVEIADPSPISNTGHFQTESNKKHILWNLLTTSSSFSTSSLPLFFSFQAEEPED